MRIRIPASDWSPRDYQLPLWSKLEAGSKRIVACWHRRSGKDDIALHWTACAAITERVGTYWHLLPQANQARKAVWDAIDEYKGQRRIDLAFPKELREATREQDMLIRFKNGSTWQVVGSDNYDSLIGSPPIGVVLSEYAYSDPNAWAKIRPILDMNGGWAMFISTPNGRNHFHALYELGQKEPGWFAERLTVEDTGLLSKEQIDRIRRELAAERGDEEADNIVRQEYFCNFDAAIRGSYYGNSIANLEAAGRIGVVPHEPRLPVITAWDIGVGDSTAIWFVQVVGMELHIIDYYENSGVGVDHYARVLKERDYTYDYHVWPHDGDDREWANNASSRQDVGKALGIKPIRILKRASVDDGVNAVRILLPRCRFDRGRCERGIGALRQYQKRWDEKLRTYSSTPLHDWSSHGSDAFRYLAQGLRDSPKQGMSRPDTLT